MIQVLNPITIPLSIPSIKGSDKKNSLSVPLDVRYNQKLKSIYCTKDIKGIKLNK